MRRPSPSSSPPTTCLRSGSPDPATQALRRLVSHRAGLVRGLTGARNRIHAICARRLLTAPVSDIFGVKGRVWLERLDLQADERLALDAHMRLLDALEIEIDAVERAIAAQVVDDRRVRHLLTVPGIGLATAASLVAVIGDVGRFPRPHKLVSYLGLDPRVRQSGGRPAFTGHISRAGQAHARGLLVEAAHAAVKTPGPLRGFFVRTRGRRGTGVAIVAVARKLAVLAWHLLTDDVDYRWAPAVRSADKLRRLELLGGAPKRFDLRGRRDGVKASRAAELDRDTPSSNRPRRRMWPSWPPGVRSAGRTRPPPTGSDSMVRRSRARARLRGGADPRSPPFATGSTASIRKNTHPCDSGSRELTVSSVVVAGEQGELRPRGGPDPPDDQADRPGVRAVGERRVDDLGHVGTARDPVADRRPVLHGDRLDEPPERSVDAHGDAEPDLHEPPHPDDLGGV